MDVEEFRTHGKEMIDYICNYLTTIKKRRVTPNIEPGYLRHMLPDEAPDEPEEWDKIMDDVDTAIMPGVTHWQHPQFHAYFPSGNSFPSILGDMLSDAIGCIGFSWVSFRLFHYFYFHFKKILWASKVQATKSKIFICIISMNNCVNILLYQSKFPRNTSEIMQILFFLSYSK